MCYNCGCEMPNNDMGKPENITNETFAKAAKAMDMSIEESRENAVGLLQKVMTAKSESNEKDWKPNNLTGKFQS